MYKDDKKLDKSFEAVDIETRCIKFWEENAIYKYDYPENREKSFLIDTPPPTISGSLHIGHIFSFTQTDIIARFQRMQGKSVFYPIGWDDNGLPTERRVQNYFNITCNPNVSYDPDFKPIHDPKSDSPKKEISRQNFIEACEELTKSDEIVFENIFKRIGHSYDWSLKYSTIDKTSSKISQTSFIELFEAGKVISTQAPTMWDVIFQSAIAQAEIEDRNIEGYYHNIKFKLLDSDQEFTIATTRPELLPACLAIVAHPDDERYKEFFGKKALVPLFDIPVPILPSAHANKEKGTGIMMVCSFGDSADVAWWKQSGLPIKQIIGLNGRILDIQYGKAPFESLNPENAHEKFSQLIGLTTKKAKEKIVELLRNDGVLIGEPERTMHCVKFYEKGSVPLEFVTSRQWFVKLLEEKTTMLSAGQQITWHPSYMASRYNDWTEGLNQDWCISRQRFFGIPFPVWYPIKENGEIDYDSPIVADKSSLPVDPSIDIPNGYTQSQRNQPGGFIGDLDVMDTWATSALTPQLAIARADRKPSSLNVPFDIRPQAHDIIRTWAFYTIAKSLLHKNCVPWRKALISGFILDPDRKKMSKSKGNVVTPIDLIEKHSSDAVRYWAAKARLGVDTAFEEKMMEQGRKLVMKMFNAAKFVMMIIDNCNLKNSSQYIASITNYFDIAWCNKLNNTIQVATKHLAEYNYASAFDVIEECFWDFCDNYIEIVKKRAYSDDKLSAVASLMHSIDVFSKLLAPFCPFITEEIFQTRPWKLNSEVSVHLTMWPSVFAFNDQYTAEIYNNVVTISSSARAAKTSANKSLSTPLSALNITTSEHNIALCKLVENDIANVCNADIAVIKYNIDDIEENISTNITL